ncbi:hypothetical protein KA005_43300, partial [bacterium]|nr:hypothetical protein [bacterium]
ISEYDDDLVKKNLSIGEIWFASQHLYWHGYPNIYQGYLDIAKLIVKKLDEISEVYENDFSRLLKYILNTKLLIECRKLHDAMIEVEQAIDSVREAGFNLSLLDMYSCKARIHMLTGDIEGAEKSLQHANKIRSEVKAVPSQLSTFWLCQFDYFLYRLEESTRTYRKSEASEYRKKAIKSGKTLLKTTKKAAQHRTESYKLMGVYYWLIKKQKKALEWWNRSIKEGERLEARPELSRVYLEVGKRFLEANSKYKKLNGIKAEEYLERAEVLFEEMDLQWDLDELSRVARGLVV